MCEMHSEVPVSLLPLLCTGRSQSDQIGGAVINLHSISLLSTVRMFARASSPTAKACPVTVRQYFLSIQKCSKKINLYMIPSRQPVLHYLLSSLLLQYVHECLPFYSLKGCDLKH